VTVGDIRLKGTVVGPQRHTWVQNPRPSPSRLSVVKVQS